MSTGCTAPNDVMGGLGRQIHDDEAVDAGLLRVLGQLLEAVGQHRVEVSHKDDGHGDPGGLMVWTGQSQHRIAVIARHPSARGKHGHGGERITRRARGGTQPVKPREVVRTMSKLPHAPGPCQLEAAGDADTVL